jgi:hypothetical protein
LLLSVQGCGLVEFATEPAAAAALAALNGAHIWPDSRSPLNLEYMVATKCQRGPLPRKAKPFGADTASWPSMTPGVHLTPAEAADKQARTLFFAAVPPRVIDAELRTLFASCGEVVELLLFRRYPKCIPSKVSSPGCPPDYTVSAAGLAAVVAPQLPTPSGRAAGRSCPPTAR